MNTFQKLSDFLETDYDENYWSDNAVILAGDMLNQFTPSDWSSLVAAWPAKRPTWRIRLADTLGEGPAKESMPILKNMLLSPEIEVAMKAADSIRAQFQVGYSGTLNQEEVGRLKEISDSNRLYKMVLADLIGKFENKANG